MTQLLRALGKNYQKSKEFLCSECHGEGRIRISYTGCFGYTDTGNLERDWSECLACDGEGTRAAQIRVKLLK